MFEAQVVLMFSVQKLSFTEKGMPSRGPRGLPYKKKNIEHMEIITQPWIKYTFYVTHTYLCWA